MVFPNSSTPELKATCEEFRPVRVEVELPSDVAQAVERLNTEDPRLLGRALMQLVLRRNVFDLLRGAPEANSVNILTALS